MIPLDSEGGTPNSIIESSMDALIKRSEGVIDKNSGEGIRVLRKPETLAAEVLASKRLLAVFLRLYTGPRSAREIIDTPIYVVDGGKLVERRMPSSTAYKVIKRLLEVGLIEYYKGIDYRKKIYMLSSLGRSVASIVAKTLRRYIVRELGDEVKYEAFSTFVARELGLDPELVIDVINASKYEGRYGEAYVAIKEGE